MHFDEEFIDESIRSLFEKAEKERYVHSKSADTFDSIAGLWFLGKDFETALARIAHNYLVSSFLLKCLGYIYKHISQKYNLPEFDAADMSDNRARASFMQALQRLAEDDRFMQWLKYSLLPVCTQILNRFEEEDLEAVTRVGTLSDSILSIAAQYVLQESGDIWVYDSIFQFAEEILETATDAGSFTNYLDAMSSSSHLSSSLSAHFTEQSLIQSKSANQEYTNRELQKVA